MIEYKASELQVQWFDGKKTHTVTGWSEDNPVVVERKWWRETKDGYELFGDKGSISIIPLNKQEFFDKYLKNLEDSLESPFNWRLQ